MLQHTLDDAASVRMGGEAMGLSNKGVDYELNVGQRHSLNGLLDYVVSVLVLDALQNVRINLLHENSLLVNKNMFQRLCLVQRTS
jgi:hypothetical protein